MLQESVPNPPEAEAEEIIPEASPVGAGKRPFVAGDEVDEWVDLEAAIDRMLGGAEG
jgi:hypothetical protein